MVSDIKYRVIWMSVSLYKESWLAVNILYLSLISEVWLCCASCEFFWVYLAWNFLSLPLASVNLYLLPNWEVFSYFSLKHIFLYHIHFFFSFYDSDDANVRPFYIVPQDIEAFFIFFLLIFYFSLSLFLRMLDFS